MPKPRRIGKIRYSREFVESSDREAMQATFGALRPLRVEFLAHLDVFEMVALSDCFDEIMPGLEPLLYQVELSIDHTRSPCVCVTFKP